MSRGTTRPSDQAGVAGTIDPANLAATAHQSGWINFADFEKIQAIVMTGVLGAGATVDAKLEQATDGAGANAKDVAGKTITQLTKASDDNSQAVINMIAEELDVTNGFTHVQLEMTIGGNASQAGAMIMGHNARYAPKAAATVKEIV